MVPTSHNKTQYKFYIYIDFELTVPCDMILLSWCLMFMTHLQFARCGAVEVECMVVLQVLCRPYFSHASPSTSNKVKRGWVLSLLISSSYGATYIPLWSNFIFILKATCQLSWPVIHKKLVVYYNYTICMKLASLLMSFTLTW